MNLDPGLSPQSFDVADVADVLAPRCRVAVLSMHTSPMEQPGKGDSGGMNVYIRKVAAEMSRRRVRSDIFTRRTSVDEPPIVEIAPGVRVVAVDAGPPRPVHKDRLARLAGRFAHRVAGHAMVDDPYDVIHAHYWLSGVAGARLKDEWGVPLIVSFHTLARVKDGANTQDDPEPLFRKRGEDRVVAAADRVVAPTETERIQLQELYGADPRKVRVVPPGVDLELFHPGGRERSRERFGFGDDPTVVFVGRLQPLKGTHVAISALAHLKRMVSDARLVIVGDDSPRGRMGESMRLALAARRLGVKRRVTFLGSLPHEDLPDLYRAADAVVIPSASESFGLVALEAAACGTPVVATSVGGLRSLVRDAETGYLVSERDPAAFAAALSRVLADPVTRERLGTNATRLAARYPWARTSDGLLGTYAEVMACAGVAQQLQGAR